LVTETEEGRGQDILDDSDNILIKVLTQDMQWQCNWHPAGKWNIKTNRICWGPA